MSNELNFLQPGRIELLANQLEPNIVNQHRNNGYIDTNPMFNLAISNNDNIARYDLIHPESETRRLWTPLTDPTSVNLIEELIGNEEHPVFFPIVNETTEGQLYEIPPSVRSLTSRLEVSPYIPEYMSRLKKRAIEFMGKVAILDRDKFGLDINDLIINHNGDSVDDVFFSVMPPVLAPVNKQSTGSNFKNKKRQELNRFISSL
ncbi:MAG: hypothetical protein NVS1B10_04230 [Candidatus Saccharimonadales bacterium]